MKQLRDYGEFTRGGSVKHSGSDSKLKSFFVIVGSLVADYVLFILYPCVFIRLRDRLLAGGDYKPFIVLVAACTAVTLLIGLFITRDRSERGGSYFLPMATFCVILIYLVVLGYFTFLLIQDGITAGEYFSVVYGTGFLNGLVNFLTYLVLALAEMAAALVGGGIVALILSARDRITR